jgi:tellurite resistance protein
VLVLLWLAKAVRHGAVLRQELPHPVQGALLALMPVALLMAVALVAGRWPQARDALLPLALVVLAGQGWMAWHVVADLSTGKTPPELVTPALYLPTVPGGFVGAMALQALGFHGWATLLMGMGLGAWALLEMRILNRLFAGPLPLALRPTLGIEMAPAAVGALAASTLWPNLPADAVMVALGVASGPVLAVLTRWRYWSEVPFNVGFWSFSFPLAAFASTTVEAVRRGDWPLSVAGDRGGGGQRGDGLPAGAHAGAAGARAAAAAGVRARPGSPIDHAGGFADQVPSLAIWRACGTCR